MSPTSQTELVRQARSELSRSTAAASQSQSRPQPRIARRRGPSSMAVMVIATGMFATVAIPAYAFAPGSNQPHNEATATTELSRAEAQQVEVPVIANTITVARDAYSATTEEELAAAKAAEAAAAAEAERALIASQFASYTDSGPSVSEFLANPPYPNFDLGSVYSVAASYQGVPYVYGGATPAGFDCSGFVMYVYAQFGISLPHSSSGQGSAGTVISEADAQPGDLVIMDGHDGFYAGGGMILHAPYEGASVRVQPIWTSDYYIVRIGI